MHGIIKVLRSVRLDNGGIELLHTVDRSADGHHAIGFGTMALVPFFSGEYPCAIDAVYLPGIAVAIECQNRYQCNVSFALTQISGNVSVPQVTELLPVFDIHGFFHNTGIGEVTASGEDGIHISIRYRLFSPHVCFHQPADTFVLHRGVLVLDAIPGNRKETVCVSCDVEFVVAFLYKEGFLIEYKII